MGTLYLTDGDDLTSVANAIRAKSGGSGQLAFPAGFVSAIGDIPTGGSEATAAELASNSIVTWHSEALTYILTVRGITSLKTVVFPNITSMNTGTGNNFNSCSGLIRVDFGRLGSIAGLCFNACSNLSTVILRKTSGIVSLNNTNAFIGTPFASGKAGGTLYVPQALISSYQSASNWSTILGYSTNSIKSIESTATDPNAPVDLTTHYIDGTLIPT